MNFAKNWFQDFKNVNSFWFNYWITQTYLWV